MAHLEYPYKQGEPNNTHGELWHNLQLLVFKKTFYIRIEYSKGKDKFVETIHHH